MMSLTAFPMLTLGLAGWLSGLLTLGFLFVCVVMILIVLIQRPQGGGLSGAFGSGAGSGQTAFGAKTGDALTLATIGIFVLFLLSAIGLNYAARPSEARPDQPAATAPAEDVAEQVADDAAAAGATTDSSEVPSETSAPVEGDPVPAPAEDASSGSADGDAE